MFISSELFQAASPGHHNQPYGRMDNTHIMLDDNFVLGKRRRNDDPDDSTTAHRFSSRKSKSPMTIKTTGLGQNIPGTSLPSPPLDYEDYGHALDTNEASTADSTRRNDSPPPAKTRRKIIPIKKAHTIVEVPIPSTTHHAGQLAACHICQSKPRLKTELDRYVDCQLCEKRTCAICIRTCLGRCRDRRICRTCSVEKGEEGDSHCLECLDKTEDHEMED